MQTSVTAILRQSPLTEGCAPAVAGGPGASPGWFQRVSGGLFAR